MKKESKLVKKQIVKAASKQVDKKLYSQKEFDAAVKLAAEDSARTAVENIRAKDSLREIESKKQAKERKELVTGKVVKPIAPAAAVKEAVKIAILKDKIESLNTSGVSTKSSTASLDAAM